MSTTGLHISASYNARLSAVLLGMEDMPIWSERAAQLMRAFRGKRSQAAFARRISLTVHTVANWESGRRVPSAARAFWAASRARVNVVAAFAAFDRELPPAPIDNASMHDWLRALGRRTKIKAIAARSGYSRYQVSRWFSGQTQIPLPAFLRVVEIITGRVSDLVGELVPISSVPSLLAIHVQRRAARTLAFDRPWTEALVRMVETEAYRRLVKPGVGWFAKRLGISVEEETACLDALVAAGVLVRKAGRYSGGRPLTVDTSAPVPKIASLKRHWLSQITSRLDNPLPGDMLGYNMISVSEGDLDRIRQLHLDYFREIRTIVAQSEPAETVALIGMQLIQFPAEL